jgi:antitoxin (DNA-binding transcriptional repressor) of toxin-antitoxin stability system
MENIIGLKEFRSDVQKIAGKVARGESFVVVKRSKPLFEVIPVRKQQPVNLAMWKKAAGMLKGKNIGDPVSWQRKIRREWERKI